MNWILLKDKQPEIGQYVFVSERSSYKKYYVREAKYVGLESYRGKKKHSFTIGSYHSLNEDEISAWMPKPEPYIPVNNKPFKKVKGVSGYIKIRKLDCHPNTEVRKTLLANYKEVKNVLGNCNAITCAYVDFTWAIEDDKEQVLLITCHKHAKKDEIKDFMVEGDMSLAEELFGSNKLKEY